MIFEDTQILHDDEIELIPIDIKGLDDFHEYSIMPEFFEYLEYKPFKSKDDTEVYLKKNNSIHE